MKSWLSSLFSHTRDFRKRGFTLIELLIVIGILGILVVAVLLTLNPGEAQRKARDAVRMKDMATLQTIMDQYVNSSAPAAGNCLTTAGGCLSTSALGQACNGGWLGTGVNICAYATTIPIDPVNSTTTRNVADDTSGDGDCADTTDNASQAPNYRVKTDTAVSLYEINVIQESDSNCNNVIRDGGNSAALVEAGTSLTIY